MGARLSHQMSGMSPAASLPMTSRSAVDLASWALFPPPESSSHVLLTPLGLLEGTRIRPDSGSMLATDAPRFLHARA
jgi:hypothetical protein